ncbi:HAMP domain-containing sensor histidine kinase [Lacihabitans soyangensis]|uniref:histidine kinase n=1 Tax=Lacihabitans soyangensis TaxID=869394 RepID=A0AAE3H8T6_9BACT|nr:HAMP domain-containing sensor histidine kinase [Lacihabitans soyangensis]MCP9765465.1 sensor histidine kinase [Lacihabitans soyangensis]
MKIRNKLILIYLAITAVLLSFFCVVIYLQSKDYRRSEFKDRLRKEALSTANIYFNKKDISPEVLKLLDRNDFTALTNEEIVIFDSKNQVIYESGEDRFKIDGDILEKIRADKEFFWEDTKYEFIGILFENQGQKYVIVSYAVDNYGFFKLQNLTYVLILGGLCILFLSALTGWFFVERMLNPIQQIIKKIDKIKASQLGDRLEVGNENDEFAQLADRFNQMLDRLQKSFMAQKAFVSHASHELRTPLTSITGQIQVSLLAEDSPEDLKKMIQSVLEDVKQLNRLSNNLLDLTSLNTYSEKSNLNLVNVLDKLSRVRDEAIKKNPLGQVAINVDVNEDEIPELLGNPPLLYTAFYNLIDNGIKYSLNQTVDIEVINKPKSIKVQFQNNSQNISDDDLKNIFEPFKRGSNSKNKVGHGVGLSLVKGIVEMHNGTIEVSRQDPNLILFEVMLPKR